MRRCKGMMVMVVLVAGCAGDGPVLPGWLLGEPTGGGETTGGGEMTQGVVGSTSEGSTTTGTAVVCGNDVVEDGEECDGTDWNGATCESLGYAEGSLACTEGCVIDVLGCLPEGMVLVPGGMFEMGSNDYANEMPIRQVQVDAFWIDRTEVTVEAYSACVADGACTEPGSGGSCNWMVAGREDHPVNCVTWFQAAKYCGWVDGGVKRLPTEAEWEKAARGTDAREYPWGDVPEPSCTHVVMNDGGAGCDMGSTWPVGSKPMGDSPFGAHDMAGNVWEWVADWYTSSYDAMETDNPTGPAMGTWRVLRGGSWGFSGSDYFRAADRSIFTPTFDFNVGFRCARTPPAPL